MPPAPDHDYERLARLARSRRLGLGLALNDANAKAAGVARKTWRRVEQGLPILEMNYRKVDAAIRWARGSCLDVLRGGEPVLIEGMRDPEADGVQKSPIPQDVLDAELLKVIQLALVASGTDSTAEEIRIQSERVAHDLRESGLL